MENNTDIKILLGKRIKELRTKRGLTQEKLSEIVGVGQRNLIKIECGKTFLTSDTLSKLLIALEVEAKELFDFEFSKEKKPKLKRLKLYDKFYLKAGNLSYPYKTEYIIKKLKKYGYRFSTFEDVSGRVQS